MNGKAASSVSAKPYYGIQCPTCQSPAKVMHTYQAVGGTQIQRRRQCPSGHRFSTMERIKK